jgi:hypothetical protein
MRVGCSGVTTKRGWRRQSRRIIIYTYYICAYSRDSVASWTTTAVIYYYHNMTADALLFARVVARVAYWYYIINTTKCATAVCYSTRAPDADDLSSRVVYWNLAFHQSAGTPVSWEFKTCHLTSGNRWQQVAFMWQQVATGGIHGNRWQQVSPGGSAIAFRFAPRRRN